MVSGELSNWPWKVASGRGPAFENGTFHRNSDDLKFKEMFYFAVSDYKVQLRPEIQLWGEVEERWHWRSAAVLAKDSKARLNLHPLKVVGKSNGE